MTDFKDMSTTEMTRVDVHDVPAAQAEQFKADREFCARRVQEIMTPYCVKIERTILDAAEGEAVVGYMVNGDICFSVLLDPFEVPVMKMAEERGRLKEYIFAANGLTEDMF